MGRNTVAADDPTFETELTYEDSEGMRHLCNVDVCPERVPPAPGGGVTSPGDDTTGTHAAAFTTASGGAAAGSGGAAGSGSAERG